MSHHTCFYLAGPVFVVTHISAAASYACKQPIHPCRPCSYACTSHYRGLRDRHRAVSVELEADEAPLAEWDVDVENELLDRLDALQRKLREVRAATHKHMYSRTHGLPTRTHARITHTHTYTYTTAKHSRSAQAHTRNHVCVRAYHLGREGGFAMCVCMCMRMHVYVYVRVCVYACARKSSLK